MRKSTARREKDSELLELLRADDDIDAAVAKERAKFDALDRRLRSWKSKFSPYRNGASV